MSSALGYLAWRSTRNRLLRQLRRLRTPRYALALVLGVAYLWYIGIRQRPPSGSEEVSAATVELLAAAGVTVVLVWMWIFGSERRALAFSRAEVTWLFPAPLTRRQLIQYKLVRGQFLILFNAVLWTILLPRGWSGAGAWRQAGGLWVLLTTLAWHRLGVALLRSSLLEHGRVAIRARAPTLVLVALALALVVIEGAQVIPAIRAGWNQGLSEFFGAVAEIARRPIPSALLLPGSLLARPLLAESWTEWSRALLPALGILVAHYVWVIRSDAAFEEAAAAAALRHRGDQAAGRMRRFVARPVPSLAPTGWPAGALLWKNLVAVVRTGRARSTVLGFIAAALAVVTLTLGGGSRTLLDIVGWLSAMWAGLLLVLGPQWIRNDLRTDLVRLATLRSYPLRGSVVVAAETAGSTAVLTALQLGLVAIAYLAFWGNQVEEPSRELRSAALAAAIVFLPAINFLAMLIQNGLALLLPGWVRLGPDRPIGVEALGHNMLLMSGFIVVLAALLLPPAALAGGLFLGFHPVAGWWAAVPASAIALVVAALEARLLLARLGRIFESTDPASVAPVESL